MRRASIAIVIACLGASVFARQKHENAILDVWQAGKPVFGVFVPNENPAGRGSNPVYTRAGGETLAANPLYDYVFLNLEGSYSADAIDAIAEGLRSPKATSRKTMIVRIPPFHLDADAGRARIKEAFALGADGVTVPHVQSVDEARQVLQAFQAAKVNVWSPSNPRGEKIAMLMIEDPGALAQVKGFVALEGISVLACGIGSMTQALGGNREAAEAATQQVLAETKRAGIPTMLTANGGDVEQRIKEGFLALLMQGGQADEAIKLGRSFARR